MWTIVDVYNLDYTASNDQESLEKYYAKSRRDFFFKQIQEDVSLN